jgi:hypothetical protein
MATIGGLVAVYSYHANPADVFIGGIEKPGDHCFCCVVLEEGGGPLACTYPSVRAFTTDPALQKVGIIDPWLNVACLPEDYLDFAGLQLAKWGSVGKRIAWSFGKQGPGWYPPNGEYAEKFAEGPVRIYRYA